MCCDKSRRWYGSGQHKKQKEKEWGEIARRMVKCEKRRNK